MSDRVLIVDDSLTVRMDLAEAFEAEGFACVLSATVAEGRAALARAAFAIAVVDLLLPDGDGVSLLREIRDLPGGGDVAVLMLSTEAEVADRVRGMQHGADEYVGKPYERRQVVARAREILRTRRGEARESATTVLVIDDSESQRQALRSALEAAGYVVVTAATGEEGLQAAAATRPDAALVDGELPDTDGATVVRKMRLDAALRATRCVLFTASEEPGAELAALEAGADMFVRKEEGLEGVIARLGAVLRGATRSVGLEATSLVDPKRVLTVDDAAVCARLASVLRDAGYDIVSASSGEAALEILAVQKIDCVVLSAVLPGMSGIQACREMKASPSSCDIPVIMVNARDDREALIEGLASGADDVVSKGAADEVLEARIRAQIRRKQVDDEHRRVRDEVLRRELEVANARAARQLAETRAALVAELEKKNAELETFAYSVSHDLRAPLRHIDGYSQMLLEDHENELGADALQKLRRIRAAAQRMGELIDDLLELSRVGRAELRRQPVDLTAMAREVLEIEIGRLPPTRTVASEVEEGLRVDADRRLLRVVLENLIGNAVKFTGQRADATVRIGSELRGGETVYFVRDNGAGFDMALAAKLFRPFQRLHSDSEFGGTGVGLATVQRVVERHGGRIWAEAERHAGATFLFTIGASGPLDDA